MLPWAIVVEASNPSIGVSCNDVLVELRRAFKIPVSRREHDHALSSSDARRRVSAAFHQRCQRIPHPAERDAEMKRGLTRADFLVGRTRFTGLVATKKGPDCWQLTTSN
jgi:adenylyl- and sulfurtransferase ThiI